MTNREFRFTSTLEKSDNKLWGGHFRVPNHIAKQLIDGKSRRVVCSLNGKVTYQCALLPYREGIFVISVNKKLRDALGIGPGTNIKIQLKKDKSEYGLPLPEELEELLKQDAEGRAFFLALTRGKQRTLLYMAGAVKNTDKRIERAIIIVNHLKANKGKINYRQLYGSFKKPGGGRLR